MENFEYSIQLNDRDWAEFYLASEECSVIQAALATAEEQLQSDLEEGEVQEDRLIRVRVGPVPVPSTASCPPRGAPCGHLLAEEVLSGSEDETELGSVSRFLCGNSQPGAALPWPSAIQGSQQPPVTSRPLGGQHELPELARECEALFASEERESETGGWLGDSNHSLPVVDVAVPKADFRGQISVQEAMEKSACSESMVVGASKGIDRQAEVHGRRSEQPTNDISQTASVDVQLPLSAGNNGENPESLGLKDLSEHPTSSSFPSADSEEAELPEKSTKHLQVHLTAEVPSFKEKSSRLQGNSVPLVGALAPFDPQSENHEQGGLERKSNEEEVAVNHKDEGRADQSEILAHGILKEVGQVDQEISSAGCSVNLQKFPVELGANKCPQLTMVTNSRSSGTSDQQRETDALKGEIQKDSIEKPCHHLGTAGPSERESLSTAQGSQRSNLLESNIPFCLALENSLESNLTTMTWPETYEYFFCDNPQEQAEKMQEQAAEEKQVPVVGQDLPEMSGPEMYEYFFTNMEGAWVGESGKGKELRLETFNSSDQPLAPPAGSQDSGSIVAEDATYISVPDVYEHFFNNGAQDRKSWKRLFLSMPASEARKAMRALKSLLSKPAQLLRSHPTSPETLLRRGSHGKMVVFSPRLQEESQPRPKDLRTAVMSPERPLRLTLTHREMCLGFVAFASWAVKTSNLQAPDAWKIVFLANFGTLSAIRYFRRQVVAEGQHST